MDKLRLFYVGGPLAWLALKYYALGTWTWEDSTQYGILLNLALLTSVAAFGTHEAYQRYGTDFLERWKHASRKTLSFALLLPLGLGLWYYGIASDALEARKTQKMQQVEAQILNDENFETLARENPVLLESDRASIVQRQQSNIEVFFSPVFYLGMAAMAWSFTGLFIAAIFAFIWPKIWAT